ncbi:hypothetical protein TNCV_4220921 [Trichonephila clavipes]|nr:hypothetical protein TNCV_4220921 [Trichonephila clavipes]
MSMPIVRKWRFPTPLKSILTQSPHLVVVRLFGDEVPAQVRSSSVELGSKLQGLSPIPDEPFYTSKSLSSELSSLGHSVDSHRDNSE